MSEEICLCGHNKNLHEANSPEFLKNGFHKMAFNCECKVFQKQLTKKSQKTASTPNSVKIVR